MLIVQKIDLAEVVALAKIAVREAHLVIAHHLVNKGNKKNKLS